ncbi:MAG: hypothetical protein U0X76_12650 [Bacteroidia bacterium]
MKLMLCIKLLFASEKKINLLICFIWRSENKPLSLQAHEEIFPISVYAFFFREQRKAISIGISDTLDHKIENFGVREGLPLLI